MTTEYPVSPSPNCNVPPILFPAESKVIKKSKSCSDPKSTFPLPNNFRFIHVKKLIDQVIQPPSDFCIKNSALSQFPAICTFCSSPTTPLFKGRIEPINVPLNPQPDGGLLSVVGWTTIFGSQSDFIST
eukprot:UN10972